MHRLIQFSSSTCAHALIVWLNNYTDLSIHATWANINVSLYSVRCVLHVVVHYWFTTSIEKNWHNQL